MDRLVTAGLKALADYEALTREQTGRPLRVQPLGPARERRVVGSAVRGAPPGTYRGAQCLPQSRLLVGEAQRGCRCVGRADDDGRGVAALVDQGVRGFLGHDRGGAAEAGPAAPGP